MSKPYVPYGTKRYRDRETFILVFFIEAVLLCLIVAHFE